MMKKLKLTAAVLAMLAALSVNVYANDAETAALEAVVEETAPVVAEIAFPGMIELNVTSSMSDHDTDTARYFDRIATTGYELMVSEENRTYTVYASIGVRDYADLLAVQLAGKPDTTVEVAVYGSNDDETWVQLDVTSPTKESGFYVFDLLGCEEKYVYWRIDFTVSTGDSFTLTEIALFKRDRGEPQYIYDLGDSLEEGELPELIPADPILRLDIELLPEPDPTPAYHVRLPLFLAFGMGR